MSNDKDNHPVEQQYKVIHTAKQILDQFSECLGQYMQGEMKAKRPPSENPLLASACRSLVALEGSMADLVIELRQAQALEELDEAVSEVLEELNPSAPIDDSPF